MFLELDQARRHWIGRQVNLRLGRRGLAILALPLALLDRARAAAGHEESNDEDSQARSAASDARTSVGRSRRARYSGWSTPAEMAAPLRKAWHISGVSSKRRKCTDEVFS